jgi:hypothetical protein
MRTTSSIAALHRGQDMLRFVLGSGIRCVGYKFGTRHKNNGGDRVKFRKVIAIFLVIAVFGWWRL